MSNSNTEIDGLMEYAITLATSELISDDLVKLASLCEDIWVEKNNGAIANKEIEEEFKKNIKKYFKANGAFRQEVEHCSQAKLLIQSI